MPIDTCGHFSALEAGHVPPAGTPTGKFLRDDGWAPAPAGGGSVPSGVILMWSGSLATIPAGFVLCDGQNGTPNLSGKFVRGAGTPGATGGSSTASFTPQGSVGAIAASVAAAQKIGTGASSAAVNNHTHPAPTFTGTLSLIPTVPPYYELAYIMKT